MAKYWKTILPSGIWTHCHIRIYSYCSFQCSIPFRCDGQIGVLRADRILRKHLRKLNRLRHIQFLEIRNLCQSKTTIRCIIWISNLTKCRGKQVTYVHDQLSFKYCAQFVRDCVKHGLGATQGSLQCSQDQALVQTGTERPPGRTAATTRMMVVDDDDGWS